MTVFLKKVNHKILSTLLNNPLINWLLVLFSVDHWPKDILQKNNYKSREYIEALSLQENVGYSHIPAIQKLVDNVQSRFYGFAKEHLKPGEALLDIGCGTGLFLKGFQECGFYVYGIDLNRQFLSKVEGLYPKAHFFAGDYIANFKAPKKYNLISSFSVMMYIEPSRSQKFFDKIFDDLNPGGYVFIQYSHAMKFVDLLYPDLTYIKYSPHKIEKIVSKKFKVIRHEHFYDGRKVNWFDTKHYFFPDGTNSRLDTLENSFLLILQKPV